MAQSGWARAARPPVGTCVTTPSSPHNWTASYAPACWPPPTTIRLSRRQPPSHAWGRPRTPTRPAPPPPGGPKPMSVAHPLAQAVLGLALLGHVVRLLAAAVNDGKPTPTPSQLQPAPATLAWPGSATGGGVLPGGDIGGDAQLDESFSVRFCHRDHAGALVIVYYYAALDLDDLTTVYVERQTE